MGNSLFDIKGKIALISRSESIKIANGKAAIEVIPDANGLPEEMMGLNLNFKGTYLVIAK